MAKVLFLSPYFVPDYAAGSVIYASLAEDLARNGHHVTVLTGMPYYGREKVWDDYKGKFLVHEKQSGYRVIRLYSFAASRANIPGRMFSWGLYNLLAAFVSLALERQDVVFAMNPFTMAGLPLMLLSWFKHSHIIYSVEDIYPDALVRAGLLTHRFTVALIDVLERACCRRASLIRTIADGMRELLVKRGIDPAKIVTLPNFCDTDFVRPFPRENSFSTIHGLNGKFVVLYAGNIGAIHGVEVVVKAAALLREHGDIVFLLVGEGIERVRLQQMAEGLRLHNIRFLPMQPIEGLPELLASADISLVTLKKEFGQESVPSKVFSILASGRSMVASVAAGTEIDRLIQQSEAGLRVDPDSPEALAGAILRLHGDEHRRDSMGRNGRQFCLAHFSRTVVSGQLNRLIEDLVCNRRTAQQIQMQPLESGVSGTAEGQEQ